MIQPLVIPAVVADESPRPAAATGPALPPGRSAGRFTLDGSDGLEEHLAQACARVRAGIEAVLPRGRIEAILLGGGYGRGEGGVLRTEAGDAPYNDLEFYVCVHGSPLLAEQRHGAALRALAHGLAREAGVEVEFKLTSLAQMRRRPISMFSYDLVLGHRWVAGDEALLAGCEHHRWPQLIPATEVTRLLMNRCSGLLFARERLERAVFTAEDADFTGRNLAKARLALGDAVLASVRRYHWSCRERAARLAQLHAPARWDWFAAVREQHRLGVEFKLHPHRTLAARAALLREWRPLAALAGRLWLWAEGRRLHRGYPAHADYATEPADKCPDTPRWRNLLVNLRHFGPAALAGPAWRHPRERLLRALPLLLWQADETARPGVRAFLQRELRTPATGWSGFVAAYRALWERFR